MSAKESQRTDKNNEWLLHSMKDSSEDNLAGAKHKGWKVSCKIGRAGADRWRISNFCKFAKTRKIRKIRKIRKNSQNSQKFAMFAK